MNNIKNQLIVIVLIIIAVLLVFVSYKLSNPEKKKEKVEEKPVEKIDNKIKYSSYDGRFQIETSKDWVEVETKKSLNKDANMELYNDKYNAYFLLVVNNKVDYKNNFTTYKNEVFQQKVLEYKTKITKYNKVIIDGYNGEYIDIDYINNKGIKTYIRSYAIETKNYYGQIMLWTLSSNKDLIQSEFDDLINNFKKINTLS